MDRPALGRATILRGDALHLALADNSVDLIVTSPPYFGLRSYQDGGEHYAGQIGDEPTPTEFVDALIAATAEMVRVVKPSGSIWINLGDKYVSQDAPRSSSKESTLPATMSAISTTAKGSFPSLSRPAAHSRQNPTTESSADTETSQIQQGDMAPILPRRKSLVGIPWRYALRCIDDLGLILRAEVIWSKPNGLPEAVTDRVRRSHEQWFHFTLGPRYYSGMDALREVCDHNAMGKIPSSVWTVAKEPLRVPEDLELEHFAAFPTEFPRRIIAGWSPEAVCSACNEGRQSRATHPCPTCGAPWIDQAKRCADCGHTNGDAWKANKDWDNKARAKSADRVPLRPVRGIKTGSVVSCACEQPTAPTVPAVVLDPFGGTGTAALVAKALGRHGISNDMSADYCRLATWRTNDDAELARAMQVDKPAAQVPGQTSLLDLFDEEVPA